MYGGQINEMTLVHFIDNQDFPFDFAAANSRGLAVINAEGITWRRLLVVRALPSPIPPFLPLC